MPDYNSKEIPTLDDVIDDKDIEDSTDELTTPATNLEAAETDEQEKPEESGGNTGGIAGESTDNNATDTDHDTSEGTEVNEANNNEAEKNISEPQHSAHDSASNPLYPTPGTSHTSIQVSYQEIYDKLDARNETQTIETSGIESGAIGTDTNETSTTEIAAIDLGTVVESVTRQIMPELEQQLKSLIQQALAEKLPEEIIQTTDVDLDDHTSSE